MWPPPSGGRATACPRARILSAGCTPAGRCARRRTLSWPTGAWRRSRQRLAALGRRRCPRAPTASSISARTTSRSADTHQMIDLSLRSDLILRASASDPRASVVLFDVVPGLRRPFRPRDRPGRSRQCRQVSRGGRWPHASVRRISLRHRGRPAGPAPVRKRRSRPPGWSSCQPTRRPRGSPGRGDQARGCPPMTHARVVPWRSASPPSGVARPLFGQTCRVINVGSRGFFETLQAVGAPATAGGLAAAARRRSGPLQPGWR